MNPAAPTGELVFLGLGSNQGDRLGELRRAVAALGALPTVEVTACSRVWETEHVGSDVQAPYLNACVAVRTGLEPLAHYAELSRHYAAPVLYGPFNLPARRAAGFRDDELSYLMQKNPDRTHPSPAATPVHAHHNDTHPRR